MKITKSQLKQIIKEELEKELDEGRFGDWLKGLPSGDPKYSLSPAQIRSMARPDHHAVNMALKARAPRRREREAERDRESRARSQEGRLQNRERKLEKSNKALQLAGDDPQKKTRKGDYVVTDDQIVSLVVAGVLTQEDLPERWGALSRDIEWAQKRSADLDALEETILRKVLKKLK